MSTTGNTKVISKGKPKVGSKSGPKGKGPRADEWDEQPHGDPDEDAPMLLKDSEDEKAYRVAQNRFNRGCVLTRDPL